MVSLFVGRIRPTLNAIRVGFRAYVNSLITVQRIQVDIPMFLLSVCFFLFLYSLPGSSSVGFHVLSGL